MFSKRHSSSFIIRYITLLSYEQLPELSLVRLFPTCFNFFKYMSFLILDAMTILLGVSLWLYQLSKTQTFIVLCLTFGDFGIFQIAKSSHDKNVYLLLL